MTDPVFGVIHHLSGRDVVAATNLAIPLALAALLANLLPLGAAGKRTWLLFTVIPAVVVSSAAYWATYNSFTEYSRWLVPGSTDPHAFGIPIPSRVLLVAILVATASIVLVSSVVYAWRKSKGGHVQPQSPTPSDLSR